MTQGLKLLGNSQNVELLRLHRFMAWSWRQTTNKVVMQFPFLSMECSGSQVKPPCGMRLVDFFATGYGKLPAFSGRASAFLGNTGLLRMCTFLHAASRVTGDHRRSPYK
jgi:hypothetical protein